MFGNQPFPTFVVEVGWSESYDDFLNDMNRLLVGGDGAIKVVVIIKFTKHANRSVDGEVEIYSRDRQGIPKLEQWAVLFPAPTDHSRVRSLEVRRWELFGGEQQPGRDPNTVFPLDIDDLRDNASLRLRHMNYYPSEI